MAAHGDPVERPQRGVERSLEQLAVEQGGKRASGRREKGVVVVGEEEGLIGEWRFRRDEADCLCGFGSPSESVTFWPGLLGL